MPTDSLGVWTAGHSKYKTRIIMAKESTIQHYTSSITGNTPSAVDLASGELAINIADEKVFLKNLLGNVVSLSQSKDLSGAFASKATVVTSFNGATGAVTGASLGANTFTALNTFNAGISSSGITGTLPSIMSSNSSGQLIITAKSSIAATPDNAVITLVGGDSDLVDPLLPSITLKASQINLGSASVNSSKLAFSVNGVTGPILITASTGIAIGSAGKNLTVTNSGVQSFNGTTGAVGYSPAFASSSVTGVAAFNSTYFSVGATGVVTLASAYQVTGQTVVSGGGSQILNTSGNTVTIDNRVASSSVTGVASFNSTYLTVSNGAVSLASAYQVTGDTVAAGTGISVSKSGNTSTVTNSGVQSFNSATGAVNYSPAIASASVTGVASFNSTYFAVGASGHVTLASSYQATGQTVVSGGSSQLVSTSGKTVTIDNRVASASVTGVASFNSTYLTVSNGAVSLASAYQVTGDTVAAGTGIVVSRSGNTSTVTNSGVLSFNSATGAVNYSPVIATTSVTGVTSFNSTHFTVSGAGAVSSAGITVKVSSGDAGSTLNSGGTLTITGTANEINIQRTASTYTIGLPTDVTIGGNLTVNGTVVTANVDSFVVEDPLIMLGTGNVADSVDLGFYSQYTTTGRLFSGFFRDASDSGKYKLFTGLTGGAEPTTTVNVAGSGYTVATLVAKIDGGSF